MTKINKVGKSTFLIAVLALILVGLLAFGGTYAYFSGKSDTLTGDFTMGHLSIEGFTSGVAGDKLVAASTIGRPGQDLFGETGNTVTTTIKSNIDYYTRVTFTVTLKAANKTAAHTENCKDDTEAEIANMLIFTLTGGGLSGDAVNGTIWQTGSTSAVPATWDATECIATSTTTYYKLAPKTAVDLSTNTSETFTFNIKVNPEMGALEGALDARGCSFWQDATIEVLASVEVLQANFIATDTSKFDPNNTTTFKDGASAAAVWSNALKGNATNPAA